MATRYLAYHHILAVVGAEHIGPVRDAGLLQSALERPATTLMGADAYSTLELKAAALLHSLCLNHALIDGNKRIAALALIMFLDINGVELALTSDELFELTMEVASGSTREVEEIAARLKVLPRG